MAKEDVIRDRARNAGASSSSGSRARSPHHGKAMSSSLQKHRVSSNVQFDPGDLDDLDDPRDGVAVHQHGDPGFKPLGRSLYGLQLIPHFPSISPPPSHPSANTCSDTASGHVETVPSDRYYTPSAAKFADWPPAEPSRYTSNTPVNHTERIPDTIPVPQIITFHDTTYFGHGRAGEDSLIFDHGAADRNGVILRGAADIVRGQDTQHVSLQRDALPGTEHFGIAAIGSSPFTIETPTLAEVYVELDDLENQIADFNEEDLSALTVMLQNPELQLPPAGRGPRQPSAPPTPISGNSTIARTDLGFSRDSEPNGPSTGQAQPAVRASESYIFVAADLKNPYHCLFCGKRYPTPRSVYRHTISCKRSPFRETFACPICDKELTQTDNLKRHMVTKHLSEKTVDEISQHCDDLFEDAKGRYLAAVSGLST